MQSSQSSLTGCMVLCSISGKKLLLASQVELEVGVYEVSNLDHNLHLKILVCSLLSIYIKALHDDRTKVTDDSSCNMPLGALKFSHIILWLDDDQES